jgi:hypothetical protein
LALGVQAVLAQEAWVGSGGTCGTLLGGSLRDA